MSTQFNLQHYLCSKEGDEWLKEVKVNDSNGKSFRYYAPPVAWEDINRYNNSSIGDFIFDVTIKMKNHSRSIRYVLRPQNMTDPIALQSTQQIHIPVGNYNGDKLRNIKLIDLLSKQELLKEIGLNAKLSGSLYEPLIDEPAHCLPDIECICGQSMQRTTPRHAYTNADHTLNVKCDICREYKGNTGTIYHCPLNKDHKDHPRGYDICEPCAGLQIRTFIEAPKINKNNNNNTDNKMNDDIKHEDAIKMQNKYSAGGMMLSVGCALMSEGDMGSSYGMEVYLHRSNKYKNGKCLCIITTSEGSTANIIEQCKTTQLRFAKNKKECDWGIEKFDTSTEEGRINERTGKSAETDMIIYFIPVEEDKPPPIRHNQYYNNDSDSDNSYSVATFGNSCTWGVSSASDASPCNSFFTPTCAAPKSKGRKKRGYTHNRRRRRSRSRSRSRSRGRNSSSDDVQESMQLKFAKHKMNVSDRRFMECDSLYPLKRIRNLPIRGFLRGAVFFDQTKKPNISDAIRLNNYLQTRYNDTELLSIHAFCVLVKSRAKLLPHSDEYYKNIGFIGNLKNKKNEDGVYDLHFTEQAKENEETCVVCMDNTISMVMVDCYHMCLCNACSNEWKMSCPICRTKVRNMVTEDHLDKKQIRIIPMAITD